MTLRLPPYAAMVQLAGTLGPAGGHRLRASIHSANVNLVASLGNDDHAITRRGCSAPGSEYELASNLMPYSLEFTEQNIRQVLGTPVALRDLNDVPDLRRTDADGWVRIVRRSSWLSDDQLRGFVGPGPEITDDRPRSEYFLWRRVFMDDQRYISPSMLRQAAGG